MCKILHDVTHSYITHVTRGERNFLQLQLCLLIYSFIHPSLLLWSPWKCPWPLRQGRSEISQAHTTCKGCLGLGLSLYMFLCTLHTRDQHSSTMLQIQSHCHCAHKHTPKTLSCCKEPLFSLTRHHLTTIYTVLRHHQLLHPSPRHFHTEPSEYEDWTSWW